REGCGENRRVPRSSSPSATRKFAVLRNRQSGPYVVFAGMSMMGDNVEHVLSYWVLWETFHSPALVGFQLLSHWTPFLLLSVYAGALAERFDCRRSEEHTSELQSRFDLVCRLLLENKKYDLLYWR